MVRVTQLRFEHHNSSSTLGIGQSRPQLSWSFEGDDTDWSQSAYELRLEHEDGTTTNHRTESSDSLHVSWPAQDLASGQSFVAQVRVSGQDGVWSEWCEKATVEAGLLSRDDWKCSLIEPSSEPKGGPHRPVVFRKEFDLRRSVSKARLYMTAHGVYSATINGKRVSDHVLAPGWTSYVSKRLIYQTFDVTQDLSEGSNILDVTVAEGWYCGKLGWSHGRYNIYGDRVGLIALLVCKDRDGKQFTIGTGEDWKWAYGPFLAAGLYDGVEYDCNETIATDTRWSLVRSRATNDNLVAPDGPPIRRMEEVTPIDITTTPSGKTIIDFGQNIVGWIKAHVNGPKGHKIVFRFAEVLEDGELCIRPLRTAKATDTLVLDGRGPMEWEPEFTFHGLRYVEVSNWPGEITKEDLTGIVIHSDMKPTSTFSCSNKLLNKLHSNIIWGTKGNFIGVPTDCPQRDERLGWTGDINMFSPTANFLFDTAGLLKSWLTDLRLEQEAANGIVPLTIPNIYDAYTKDAQAIWGDAAVMVPWSLYLAFGDRSILEDQYQSMKTWLRAIPRRPNGLWNYTADWKLGDWLDPAAPPEDPGMATTDPTHVSDAFLVHVTTLMSQISSLVSDKEGTESYTTQAKDLRKAFEETYITPSGLLADNTQTAYALALAFDLIPSPPQRETAASRLESLIRRNKRFHIATGFAGTPYLPHALSKAGKSNIFYRMLLTTSCPSWLYPVTMGATTVWERWDSMLADRRVNPGQMTSFNHYAFGSVGSWMYHNILGLRIREAGWGEFEVRVVPGGNLRWAEGGHESPYGNIEVRWRIQGDEGGGKEKFWIEVKVPPNTEAHVSLPGNDEVSTRGSGRWTWEIDYLDPGDWPPSPIIAPDATIPEGELAYYDESLPCPW